MESKKMIIDYTHRQAGHCESGATSNLFKFNGLELSEPMAFGLGNGLYFSYIPFLKVQYAPMMSFRNLPNTVFKRSTNYLGIGATVIKKFKDPAASMEALDRNLEQGLPTGVQVGVFQLPFFPPEYRMHYNMHNMVIFGREGDIYHVSDTVMEHPQLISYSDLVRVRYAKGPFAPEGKMYWIHGKIDQPVELKPAIALAIKKTVKEMIGIPFPLIGVKGIRWMARDIKKWPKKHGNDKSSCYLGQVLRMAEDFGTGGAGFRYIYGSFLKEVGELYNHQEMLECADMMGKTGNKWREFTYTGARNCKNRSKPEEDYTKLGNMMADIADSEEQVYRKLQKIIL